MYDPAPAAGSTALAGANELRVNRNAGAESTIEALLALLAVVDDPVASPLPHRPHGRSRTNGGVIVEAERGDDRERLAALRAAGLDRRGVLLRRPLRGAGAGRQPGDAVHDRRRRAAFDLYLAHLRQAPSARRLDLEAVRAPSRADDRCATPPTGPKTAPSRSDRPSRSCEAPPRWPGPDRASHGRSPRLGRRQPLRRSPTFAIPTTSRPAAGPDVWRGDAVVAVPRHHRAAGSRIDVKLTLAQTPIGPAGLGLGRPGRSCRARRSPGARLPGGYRYEAALPWDSLQSPGGRGRWHARVRGRPRLRRRVHRLDGDRSGHALEPRAADAGREATWPRYRRSATRDPRRRPSRSGRARRAADRDAARAGLAGSRLPLARPARRADRPAQPGTTRSGLATRALTPRARASSTGCG